MNVLIHINLFDLKCAHTQPVSSECTIPKTGKEKNAKKQGGAIDT